MPSSNPSVEASEATPSTGFEKSKTDESSDLFEYQFWGIVILISFILLILELSHLFRQSVTALFPFTGMICAAYMRFLAGEKVATRRADLQSFWSRVWLHFLPSILPVAIGAIILEEVIFSGRLRPHWMPHFSLVVLCVVQVQAYAKKPSQDASFYSLYWQSVLLLSFVVLLFEQLNVGVRLLGKSLALLLPFTSLQASLLPRWWSSGDSLCLLFMGGAAAILAAYLTGFIPPVFMSHLNLVSTAFFMWKTAGGRVAAVNESGRSKSE